MKKILPLTGFLLILFAHFLYTSYRSSSPFVYTGGKWASFRFQQISSEQSPLFRYFNSGDMWLGMAYGLAAAFAVFSITGLLQRKDADKKVSAGGLTLSGLLWMSICFLVGCCGSPMLPIYISLLGSRFLRVTKPLTFVITLVSIGIAYTIMQKRKTRCGRG